MFPLKNWKYKIPEESIHPGGFSTLRKFDHHTGVDLYCNNGDSVFSIEKGIVVDICKFTGFDESPWWEDTWAVIIKGNSGYILYGEVNPLVKIGEIIKEGQLIANVKKVLKKDKGKNPTSMLHMELYDEWIEPVWWKIGEEKPNNLKNITQILCQQLIK
jgi:murein DD-endopeptidase MepM/ murein hydrolase activator NlpD